jgi:hypothetical protein
MNFLRFVRKTHKNDDAAIGLEDNFYHGAMPVEHRSGL